MQIDTSNETLQYILFLTIVVARGFPDIKVGKPKDLKSTLTPSEAIHKKCLDCAGTWYEIKKCSFTNCPTHHLRLGTNIPKGTSRVEAIRKYCVDWCMNKQSKEVRLCPCTDCYFHPFRMRKNPNRSFRVDEFN